MPSQPLISDSSFIAKSFLLLSCFQLTCCVFFTMSSPPSPPRRRKAAGIDAFATKKGVTRAIQEYKHRQTKRRVAKAALLREYRKAVQQEGYSPDKKRKARRPQESSEIKGQTVERESMQQSDQDVENHDTVEQASWPKRRGKPPKMNPFVKSLQKAQQRKQEQESKRLERVQYQKEVEKKQKERKRQTKLLAKRTKKGQPVMKHVIQGLLTRIEKET
jgi:hypothetical protein